MLGEQRLELFPLGAGCELELAVECIQPKDVTMRAVARRRAGAAIADRAEAVAALRRRNLSLAQPACLRRQPPGEPVREGAAGSVGIVDDERKRPRSIGRARPLYSTGIALDGSNAALASEKRSSVGMARLSRAGTAPKPDLRFDVAR